MQLLARISPAALPRQARPGHQLCSRSPPCLGRIPPQQRPIMPPAFLRTPCSLDFPLPAQALACSTKTCRAPSPLPHAHALALAQGLIVFSRLGVYLRSDAAPAIETFPAARAIDAVSLALMATYLRGDYNADPALGAATEWIVAFPTKRFYTDVESDAAVRAPFTDAFRDDGRADSPGLGACEQATAVMAKTPKGRAREHAAIVHRGLGLSNPGGPGGRA